MTYTTEVEKNDLRMRRYDVAGTLNPDGKISSAAGLKAGLPNALHRGNEVTRKEKHGND
jgi:hypothetical protein